MPHVTLHSPEITCDHCLATIRTATDAITGARFVTGDPNARSFVVDLESGSTLDQLATALAEQGYALGDASAAVAPAAGEGDAPEHGSGPDPRAVGWQPAYRVTRTAAGADVNYDCYCGCDAGFALDRAHADAAPESCCCGNHMLVGREAGARLTARLDEPGAYRVELVELAMPWGQPLEVALAIPSGGAEGPDNG